MPSRFFHKLSYRATLEWILRRPIVVLFAIAAVTLLFAWHIPGLSFRTSIYDLVIEDLPETTRYEDFKAVFGSEEIIRVVIKGDNIFDPVTFKKIEQLSGAATSIPGVRRVISLPGIRKDVDVSGRWSLEEFAKVISPVELFWRNLISEDFKTTALTLILHDNAEKESVIQAVNDLIAGAPKDLSLYQIGMPLVSQALARFTEKDFFRLPPITFILIAIILLFLFRNFQGFFLPLTCVILTLVWTFGLMAWIGIPMSMLTMIVPVFLIAVGTAYCLHIVSEYMSCARHAGTPAEAAFSTFSSITFPTVLAVFTTIVGLGSLLANRITAIREFALFSCFGMFSLLVIVLTLFPAFLAIIPLPKKKRGQFGTGKLFNRFLDWIVHLNLNKQQYTLPIIGVLVVFCIVGIFRIRVETNPVGYFKKSTPVSCNFHDIYKDLSGSFPINVVMEGKEEDYFEDPEHVADIARLQNFLQSLPGVDKTVSFVDYMKLVNYALNRFEPKYYTLPEESYEVRMLINNYKSMLGEDMLLRFMNPDFSKANILLLTHISSSGDFLETREKILDHVRQHFSKEFACDVTGFGMVISASSHLLTSGQVKSLSITMIIVFGIMFVLFLSSKVGLIAIIPNLFPIIINFGIMGWIGIELSMVTSLIASVAIGLAVDDTIHYLFRYNREFRKDLDSKRALKEALNKIGRPIIFTTLIISIGFSILAISSFKPTAIFGAMMVITMLSALVGDLILLPSLMLHVELVTIWDLVRIKLGKDPQQGIPLFRGLSRTQIHYILMAGNLKKIDAGEVLFRKGDQSDSMYAIISGAMNVVDPITDSGQTDSEQTDSGRTDLRQYKTQALQRLIVRLKTGDVMGEMGLVRSAKRSATLVATEPAELLQINWKMVKRLQWLYPPTAQQFYLNLMTILCDRLETATRTISVESLVVDQAGFYSKKGFLKILDVEIHRSRRYGVESCLCLVEIDFESVSPGSSYDVKDRILYSISQAFLQQVRKSDIMGRLDFNTFAVLLPQTPAKEAWIVCNRLKDCIKEKHFENNNNGLRVTVGTGLVGLVYDIDETGADLLSRAWEALQDARKLKTSQQKQFLSLMILTPKFLNLN